MKNRILALAASLLLATITTCSFATIHTVIPGDSPGLFNNPVTGGNFTMYNPQGALVGAPAQPTQDVQGAFDDSIICFDELCTDVAMTLSSQTLFQGFYWSAHDIRVFGPGTYTFDTGLPGNANTNFGTTNLGGAPLTMTVGPGQLGAHMLFDWSNSTNIDVCLVWNFDAEFTEISPFDPAIPSVTRTWDLASSDPDGDGIDGIKMVDGPFLAHNANFSVKFDTGLDPATLFPPLSLSAQQPGNPNIISNVVDTNGAAVTVLSGVPVANTTFDWSSSDAPLVTANTNGTTSSNFIFDPTDPAILAGTTLTARVTATNTTTGLSSSGTLPLQMSCPADSNTGLDTDADGTNDDIEGCTDSDGDGIPDWLDPAFHTANQISISLPDGSIAVSDAGSSMAIGALALVTPDSRGDVGSGILISSADIGIADGSVQTSCSPECFDFRVSGGGLAGKGTSVNVVLHLSAGLPVYPEYRKQRGNSWFAFVEDAFNAVNSVSSAGFGGNCPPPGDAAWNDTGLIAGNDCMQLTIEDDGPNDAANATAGLVRDPGGPAEGLAPAGAPLPPADGTRLGSSSGCSMTSLEANPLQHIEWWILTAFVAWRGWTQRKLQ